MHQRWGAVSRFAISHAVFTSCLLAIASVPVFMLTQRLMSSESLSVRLAAATVLRLLLSVLLICLMHKLRVVSPGSLKYGSIGKPLLLTCVGIALAIVAALYVFVMLPANRFLAPEPADFWIASSSQLLGVAVYEEVLFRGLILGLLLKKMGLTRQGIIDACLVQSAIFGLWHAVNLYDVARSAEHLDVEVVLPVLSQVFFTAAFALVAAALFLRSGTLWIPILVHGTGNLVVQTGTAYISRQKMMQFVDDPVTMSTSEFFSSTLLPVLLLVTTAWLLLRKLP